MKFNIWEDYKYMDLPDVLSFIVDNRGKTVPTDPDGNHILIATNCIRNERLYPSYEKIRTLNEEIYQNWFRAHPEPGDIIFVNKGTPGRVCMVPDPVDFCIAQDMMAFRVNPGIVYNKYLFAVLRSNKIQNQILSTTVGDVIPHFKKQHLHEIKIPIPPMDVQRIIGDYYFAFCEKEVHNDKINRNLAEQTQAVFAREFLDIDGLPDGWKEGSLIDIADYLNGLAMQRFRPEDDEIGIPVLKIKELRQGFCDASSELCSPNVKPEYIINDGDVIFSWSGSLLVDFWCGGECGLNQHLFKVTSKEFDKWFYYAWTLYHLDKFIAIAADKATTMGHIKREELSKAEVLIPSKDEYERIGTVLKPMYDMIITNRLESRKLVSIRDMLLPKLMSGEIDVLELEI